MNDGALKLAPALPTGDTTMRIAVLGAGHVGGTLGRAWAAKGHRVRFGVPDPDNPGSAGSLPAMPLTANVEVRNVADAVTDAEVVVLATPWPAVREALRACGDLSGRILIDCTNPTRPDFSWLEDGYAVSGAERVAEWARGASVFKAFNQTGWENMADPVYDGWRTVMFTCGDDEAAKPAVLRLVEDVGFEAVDAGPLLVARLLEPLAMLWIHLAHGQSLGREFGFALLRRQRT